MFFVTAFHEWGLRPTGIQKLLAPVVSLGNQQLKNEVGFTGHVIRQGHKTWMNYMTTASCFSGGSMLYTFKLLYIQATMNVSLYYNK